MQSKFIVPMLLCFFIIRFPAYSAEYQWNVVKYPFHELEDTADYTGVYAFNESSAVIVGNKGTIITFINNDSSLIQHFGHQSLRAIDFSNTDNGWAVGDEGMILQTRSRGQVWEQQQSPAGSNLHSVSCPDSMTAWAVGDSGTILHTIDGGLHWSIQTIIQFDTANVHDTIKHYTFASVSGVNNQLCWTVGNCGIDSRPLFLRTIDGGAHWTEISFHNAWFSPITSIHAIDSTLRVSAKFQLVNARFNAAKNELKEDWDQTLDHEALEFMDFSDSSNGYTVSQSGIISTIHEKWSSLQNRFIHWSFHAVSSPCAACAWAVGARGIVVTTTDSGVSWKVVHKKGQYPKVDFTSVFFQDASNGWIAGNGGIILHTIDGGTRWQAAENALSASLGFKSTWFLNENIGWAIGTSMEYDVQYKTIDGGKNWIAQNPSENQSLLYKNCRSYSQKGIVSFSDKKNWDVPQDIAVSTDGGVSWQSRQFGSKYCAIKDLFPFSADTFWAVGYNPVPENMGILWKTSDGGKSFDQIISVDHLNARGKSFASIAFPNPAIGWVVGDSGLMLRSLDSGATWTRRNSPTQLKLEKIRFFNGRFGWMYGSGKIFMTKDSGNTWEDKSFLSSSKINDALFSDSANCWVVGDSGVILHLGYDQNYPYLRLIAPKADTSFCRGDSIMIAWQGNGMTKVSIALSYDSGEHYTIYCTSTDNDGAEKIRISANAGVSDKCMVRLSNLDGSVTGESGFFSIHDVNSVTAGPLSDSEKITPRILGSKLHFAVASQCPVSITLQLPNGRICYQHRIPSCAIGEHNEAMPLHALTSGCYIVRIKIGSRSFLQKAFLCQ